MFFYNAFPQGKHNRRTDCNILYFFQNVILPTLGAIAKEKSAKAEERWIRQDPEKDKSDSGEKRGKGEREVERFILRGSPLDFTYFFDICFL